jgi:hypothetical protein
MGKQKHLGLTQEKVEPNVPKIRKRKKEKAVPPRKYIWDETRRRVKLNPSWESMTRETLKNADDPTHANRKIGSAKGKVTMANKVIGEAERHTKFQGRFNKRCVCGLEDCKTRDACIAEYEALSNK